MAEIYRALVADQDRLDQIVTDVLTAHRQGANILVLTTWVNHLDAITRRLCDAGCEATVLRGELNARALENHPATRSSPARTTTAADRWDRLDVVPPKSWRVSYAASGLVLDSLIS